MNAIICVIFFFLNRNSCQIYMTFEIYTASNEFESEEDTIFTNFNMRILIVCKVFVTSVFSTPLTNLKTFPSVLDTSL